MLRKALWAATLASGVALITSSTAVAAITPVLISGPSPYAACSTHDNSLTGRTFLDAEVEPQVAVHGSNAIAVWHQDRKSNGGAHGIGIGFSTNSGNSWGETTISLNACGPAPVDPSLAGYFRASDPWVSIGPDGTAYFSALSFNIQVPNGANAVVAARSVDGGATWDHIQRIPGGFFDTNDMSTDKNATTADPVKAGVAYTVWDTLILPTDNPDDNPHAQAYTGPAYFSKTTDGGQTWSDAKVIIDTKNRQQTIGNIIVVAPNGTLYDFCDLIVSPNTPFQGTRSNQQLAFVKSTDGGDTWTQPKVIAPLNNLGVHDPFTGEPLRVGDVIEEVAVDPSSGRLYAAWESSTKYQKQLKQSRGAWDDEILVATSGDGGDTWVGPTVVERLPSGLPTFTPSVAVNGGRVAVTYYDTRNLAAGQTDHLPTDYWVKYSTDGGATWGGEQHIAGPFDSRTAPIARGFFLGDYEGLQPSGTGFMAAFVKTNCDAPYPASNPLCAAASSNIAPTSNTNPTDVFVATLP
ncbi:MAG: exo-alpha-sialidase [Chloroflexi bacterium]|nr:MAG: exo-alpha-sialidase [Chloroflexota bacterium]